MLLGDGRPVPQYMGLSLVLCLYTIRGGGAARVAGGGWTAGWL